MERHKKPRTACAAPPPVSRLRLEAIFHRKFENERPNHDIRRQMCARVVSGEGYVEASVKHSGSLLLWSGGQRFYSKNSTGNVFAKAGEVLLLRHFMRCHGMSHWKAEYEKCSACLQRRRLTCSFEVVASTLGHHGDLPQRDYLILIAVADRSHGGASGPGRFYSTRELVDFAQAHRLPHNDAWLCGSTAACDALFAAYDALREDGTTATVLRRLDAIVVGDAACAKVSSLHPHDVFQGEVLEGLVVRYIPYDEAAATGTGSMEDMRRLGARSDELLRLVPPSLQVETSSDCALQCADLRALAANNDFEAALDGVLSQFHGQGLRRTRQEEASTSEAGPMARSFNLISIANEIMASAAGPCGDETKQIARLIKTLDQLNVRTSYKIIHETGPSSAVRHICIVHIHYDEAFAKYNHYLKTNPGMMLYRGFSIELDTSEDSSSCDMEVDTTPIDESKPNIIAEEQLMLKMKFLPYMVRTFICRNGLDLIQDSGCAAFEHHAVVQLSKWKTSQAAMDKWLPFLRGWAAYCAAARDSVLPPLSPNTYLHHLYAFEKRYKGGEFHSTSDQSVSFRGIVVLVGLVKLELETLASTISKELKCTRIVHNVNALTEKDVLLSKQMGGGLLCVAEIEDTPGNLRKLTKKNVDAIQTIFFVGGNPVSSCGDDSQRLKKISGLTNAWKNTKCASFFELPAEAVRQRDIDTAMTYLNTNAAVKAALDSLRESSHRREPDNKPGLIVFFPSIPGTGKSSLCHELTKEALGIGDDRSLLIKEGDRVKKQFYKVVAIEALKNPAAIVVIDKNVPPSSFPSIHNLSIESQSYALPAMFSGMKDTVIGQHVYPFTLKHLAVCISRVLKRKPKSHKGKLDAGTKFAWLIVVKFYCFYRHWTTTRLKEKFEVIGSGQCSPVSIPFFKDEEAEAHEMPPDLKASLEDAVLLQTRIDFKSKECCGLEDQIEMEERLTSCISNNQEYIDNLTPCLDVSKEEFVSGVHRAIAKLQDETETTKSSAKSIKIASLDFDSEAISKTVQTIRAGNAEVEQYFSKRNRHKGNEENDKTLNRHITSLHCTYAHTSEVSQAEMMSTFRHIIGTKQEVTMTALLYNEDIAAIELQMPEAETTLRPTNEFAHITLWCREGIESYKANDLPAKVSQGEAKRVEFAAPITIMGSFSFWYEV